MEFIDVVSQSPNENEVPNQRNKVNSRHFYGVRVAYMLLSDDTFTRYITLTKIQWGLILEI